MITDTNKTDAILQAYARLSEEDRITIDALIDILRLDCWTSDWIYQYSNENN